MIRLHDANGQAEARLAAQPTGEVTISASVGAVELAAYRSELAADVLARTLERGGVRVRRAPAEAGQADVTVRSGDPPASGARLTVAGLLVDTQERELAGTPPDLATVEARGFSPAALRYFGLAAHYREPWIFSWNGLTAASCALEGLACRLRELTEVAGADQLSAPALALRERFEAALADDLDTPSALEVIWQAARSELPPAELRALLLDFDRVLDLGLEAAARPATDDLPSGARELIEQRAAARRDRDWPRSDQLRAELTALGVETQDSPQGSSYRRILSTR